MIVVPSTATTMEAYSFADTPAGKWAQGVMPSVTTWRQGTDTDRITATNANSAKVSHLSTRTVRS